jgi:hypothetical protein
MGDVLLNNFKKFKDKYIFISDNICIMISMLNS